HAQQRIQRPLDRMEQQGDDFTSRLRSGFLAEAARQPDRIIVLDATQSIETVHAEIVQHAQRVTQLKPAR
ncbi:MAG: dTMP kinase, partial [Planctomycetota bacterium]|nr:dTMP kinase [Planctomycetota bacterium]